MKKEFIPYEQALELIKLGFDEECLAVANVNSYELKIIKGEYNKELHLPIPLYQQAFRWLREKYSCQSYIDILNNSFAYWIGIKSINFYYHSFNSTPRDNKFDTSWETYESAELACLKKLIEIAKNK